MRLSVSLRLRCFVLAGRSQSYSPSRLHDLAKANLHTGYRPLSRKHGEPRAMKWNSLTCIALHFLAVVGFSRTGIAEDSVADSHPPPTSKLSRSGIDDVPGDEQAIPDGFHLEEQPRKALEFTGIFTFGVPYMLSVAVGVSLVAERTATAANPLWLLVPVAGPFALMLSVKNGGNSVLFVDGCAQAVGVALITSSFIWPRRVLVRNQSAHVELTPMRIGAATNGIGLIGSF